ncbi:pyridoxamine 5'-phosphate oxidase family protein [Clostridium cellulovorans]|uniref:Pyridoxamine 5'-phosphate oxidase-related FMN-binding n=1 Tax=Clostridium cellulovorans (strain ATCC 35296 / DSM 3052 / OCM 3 / 743B) TaxID=573061 RepID=D9SVW4_CLOC7|nr:pyridoxamine 5'-phosphate oxidase family protein [Clostridium cellulovorans]ADL53175.1 pyridoxamine 5'-phosphate oxidase-related FMN-binding [Clostridium cellulovorans 743B]
MSSCNKKIKEYIANSPSAILATVDSENNPNLRAIGGYGVDEFTVYFSTAKKSNKVKQIEENNNISLLFQHENQKMPNFINVEIKGIAENLEDEEAFNEGFKFIAERRPKLKASKETHNIYKITPKQIKVLDFSKENPDEKIRIIEV